jgi:electron transfer flavoprotein beta subunit
MKILVPIKRAIDYNIKPRVNRNGDGVVTEGVKI